MVHRSVQVRAVISPPVKRTMRLSGCGRRHGRQNSLMVFWSSVVNSHRTISLIDICIKQQLSSLYSTLISPDWLATEVAALHDTRMRVGSLLPLPLPTVLSCTNKNAKKTLKHFGTRERVDYERCFCSWGSCCYQIFKVLKLFRFSTDRN